LTTTVFGYRTLFISVCSSIFLLPVSQ